MVVVGIVVVVGVGVVAVVLMAGGAGEMRRRAN